jgi:hypothetical protein
MLVQLLDARVTPSRSEGFPQTAVRWRRPGVERGARGQRVCGSNGAGVLRAPRRRDGARRTGGYDGRGGRLVAGHRHHGAGVACPDVVATSAVGHLPERNGGKSRSIRTGGSMSDPSSARPVLDRVNVPLVYRSSLIRPTVPPRASGGRSAPVLHRMNESKGVVVRGRASDLRVSIRKVWGVGGRRCGPIPREIDPVTLDYTAASGRA